MDFIKEAEEQGYIVVDKKELTTAGYKVLNDLLDGVVEAIIDSPHIEIGSDDVKFKESARNIFLTMFGSTYETFLYLYPHRFDFTALVDFNLGKDKGELQ